MERGAGLSPQTMARGALLVSGAQGQAQTESICVARSSWDGVPRPTPALLSERPSLSRPPGTLARTRVGTAAQITQDWW